MKFLLFISLWLVSFSAVAAPDCEAPESVKNLAKLLEQTFDGSKITCNDGSSFSSKFVFECKGAKYFAVKDPSDLTRRADGTDVYVVTVISEQEGTVRLTELTYPNAAAYSADEKPKETTETKFISLSDKSFSFYSADKPTAKSWISSTWFIVEDEEQARGYKLYADRVATCKAGEGVK